MSTTTTTTPHSLLDSEVLVRACLHNFLQESLDFGEVVELAACAALFGEERVRVDLCMCVWGS